MSRVVFILVALFSCLSHSSDAQSGDGICPDSIYVFQHNDLEFEFEIPGTDPGTLVSWNFGDGTEFTDDSTSVHVFAEGSWQVTAIFMDNDCPWDGPTVLSIVINVSPCWMELSAVEIESGLFTVTAIGYPEKYPMHWDMGDGTLITETWVVDHQYDPGTYEACAWIVTDFCYVDTLEACVTISYVPDHIDNDESLLVRIYPNPCNEMLIVEGHMKLPATLTLISSDGQMIILEIDGNRVDVTSLAAGVYVVSGLPGYQPEKKLIITRNY